MKPYQLVGLFLISSVFISLIAFFGYYFLVKEPNYNLSGLHPEVQQAKNQLIENSKKRGISIQITQGFRSIAEQDQLYAQGREKPGSIVTNAKGGRSYHNYGLAIDFAVINPQTQKITWDTNFDGNQNGQSDWVEVAEEGKKLGFEWGGDWQRFKDTPHLQMTFGQSIWMLNLEVKMRNFLF